MRLPSPTISAISRRPGSSWLGRIGYSNLFALVISLSVHLAIFLGMYMAIFRKTTNPARPIVPEAWLTAADPASPPQNTAPLKLAQQPGPIPMEIATPELQELPIAAITLDDSPDIALPLDQQPETSTSLTSVAMVSSASTTPVSTFFGQAGNAYKVVFVVDVSASLMIYIDDIIREMRRSIQALVPTQRFHIVLAKPREVVEFEPRRLVPAIGRYKMQVMRFLDTISGVPKPGKADPIEAMKRAFAVGPELIYLLSDGDYPDIQSELEGMLLRLNPHKRVKITTIGFDPSPGPRALLERIARQHGGHSRVVVSQ